MSRRKAPASQKRFFSKTAKKTRAINVGLGSLPRGGYRL